MAANIKTREVVKGTIKTLDKSQITAARMKQSYMKTKESIESASRTEESSPSEYAVNSAGVKADVVIHEAMHKADIMGRRSTEVTKQNLIKSKEKIMERKAVSTMKSSGIVKMKVKRKPLPQNVYRAQRAKNLAIRNLRGPKVAVGFLKRTVLAIARAFKAAIAGTKALISAIIAGGWVAVLVIIICCLFGAAFHFFGDESNGYIPVSSEVEAYTPVITEYAKKYDIEEYVELIKAVMMQESGGKGTDPMQASESGYNKKYDRKPSAIKDANYSIECGVQALKACLKKAGVQDPLDMERIKLAIQGYNFGNGYVDWALSKYGGYTKANALEFSKKQAKKSGTSSYGDPNYVDHVLRYYPYGNYTYDIIYNGPGKLGLPIEGMTRANISSHFGGRASPGGIGSINHQGVDIAFPMGTKILACESGKVIHAGWAGGLGKCVIIDHGAGLQTVYGHMSEVGVAKGQQVMRGQVIGKVGSTGNSTGPHLHLGVKVNGSYVNPEKGWLSVPR